jgi:serine/threonine-protein kinase RsbW
VTDQPDVRLTLPARAENVAVVRQALTGLADVLGMDGAVLADMKMAVTEACTNVIVHAYPNGDGPLEVDLSPGPETVTILVRDRGRGMQPRPADPDTHALGLGLPLIAALADGYEISGGGEGTEVRMVFALDDRLGRVEPIL